MNTCVRGGVGCNGLKAPPALATSPRSVAFISDEMVGGVVHLESGDARGDLSA